MTRDEIRNINDDYGFRGAIPYIYTNGHNWFILWWKDTPIQLAGWSCNKYVTTNQIPS